MPKISIYKKKGFLVYDYYYNSLEDLLKYCVKKELNPIFLEYEEEEVRDSFYGDYTFSEAWNLCYYMNDKGYKDFKEKINIAKFKKSFTVDKVSTYKVCGYNPNVARMLAGNLYNMRSNEVNKINKGITINMNTAISSFESVEAIYNRGCCVINLIQSLENSGFKVEFLLQDISYKGNEMVKKTIVLKNEDEHLNIKRCYFPITNPSFERRINFRSTMIILELKKKWLYLGKPYIKTRKEINEMDNTIYISTPNEMGIIGDDLVEDSKKFSEYINRYYSKLINNEEDVLNGNMGKHYSKK